jgi:hypothetical protein
MKMIDNNVAITFTIRVAMDTINLTQGWQKGATPTTTLESSLEAISWQCFKQEYGMKGFVVMNPPNFSRDEVLSNGVTILVQSSKVKRSTKKST